MSVSDGHEERARCHGVERHAMGAACLFLVAACDLFRPEGERLEDAPPLVALSQVRGQLYRGSRRVGEVRARALIYPRAGGELVALDATLTDESDAGALSAARIVAPLDLTQAEGEGGVTLRRADGVVGRTGRARYDGARRVVSGDTPLRLEGKGLWIESSGFSFDLANEHYVFDGGVRSRVGGGGE